MTVTQSPPQQVFASLGRPDNLPDEIAQQVRQRIMNGEFAPGERLPTEYELAEMFAVSRNVVREAIARLKLAGYVDTRRGVGTFVAQDMGSRRFEIAPEDLLQADTLEHVFSLRVEIEAGAAAIAAQHRTPEQLAQLASALRQVDASGDDWEQGAATALDFHMAVGVATNNPYFVQLMTHLSHVIRGAVRTLRYRSAGTERIEQIEREHHLIFNAIESGDSDAARLAMRTHLTNGMQRYKAADTRTTP
ncbi:FadR/GntR family transcriptional regulator [Alcaligenaceae bacterium A4P071]|nr:FadR/GntR family transcriptional regulator [Alcaligenaceae bacterium A4P071]